MERGGWGVQPDIEPCSLPEVEEYMILYTYHCSIRGGEDHVLLYCDWLNPHVHQTTLCNIQASSLTQILYSFQTFRMHSNKIIPYLLGDILYAL